MKYQVGLYESPQGLQVADHSAQITELQWSTDTGGDKDLTYTAIISPREAVALFDRREILHVQVSRGMEILWQGRVTAAGVSIATTTSVRIQALGYRVALYDTLYTALWQDVELSRWLPLSGSTPNRADLYNVLQSLDAITITMQPRQYTTNMRGRVLYTTPSRSRRPITEISINLDYDIPAGITITVTRAATTTSAETTISTITGPSSSASTTISDAWSSSLGVTAIRVGIVPTTNVTIGSTNDYYVRILPTLTRIGTLDTGLITPIANDRAVIRDMIASINEINPDQIIASSARLEVVPTDSAPAWSTIIYADQRPGNILDTIASKGNGKTVLEWGVDQQRVVYMRPATAVQTTWQVHVDSLTMDRMNIDLYNSVYSVTTVNNAVVRSAAQTDANSINLANLTRQQYVDLSSSTNDSNTQPIESQLKYLATPLPEIRFTAARVILFGAIVESYRVRAGDAVEITNVTFIGVDELTRKRTFRVIETRYDAIADRMDIVPEKAPPRLEDVVGR